MASKYVIIFIFILLSSSQSSTFLLVPAFRFRKDDVREEANRGLKPQFENETDSEKSIAKYPSFVELCDYLHIKVEIVDLFVCLYVFLFSQVFTQ